MFTSVLLSRYIGTSCASSVFLSRLSGTSCDSSLFLICSALGPSFRHAEKSRIIYSEINFNKGTKIGCPFSALKETLFCLILSPSLF